MRFSSYARRSVNVGVVTVLALFALGTVYSLRDGDDNVAAYDTKEAAAMFASRASVAEGDSAFDDAAFIADDSSEKSSKATSKRRYRLLAFGDSLTEGYYRVGRFGSPDSRILFHPYALELGARLNEYDPNVSWAIENHGISGECVIQKCVDISMVDSIGKILDAGSGVRMPWQDNRRGGGGQHKSTSAEFTEDKGRPFDVVVVLGGTNDLSPMRNISADAILEGLIKIHKTIWKHNIKSIALTVPGSFRDLENGHEATSDSKETPLVARREVVNKGLRTMVKEHANRTTLVDVNKVIPYSDPYTDKSPTPLFADGVHFSPAGYDKLAGYIFDALLDAGVITKGDNQ